MLELRKKNAREILEKSSKQSSTIDHFPKNFNNEALNRKSVNYPNSQTPTDLPIVIKHAHKRKIEIVQSPEMN